MKSDWLKTVLFSACMAAAGIACASTSTLTVYTAFETDDLSTFKKSFESKHPDIKINWVRNSTGIISAKLKAEKNNPRADVIWGVSVTDVEHLKREELLEPFKPSEFDTIPAKFKDNAAIPSWTGTNGYVAAMIYNTEEGKKLNIPQPQSWEDLLKPEYKGRIVMPNPAASGTGFLCISGWIQAWGEDKAWAYMDRLHQNISLYTQSGSAPAVQASRGEALVGIAFELRGARLLEDGAPIAITLPQDALGWDLNGVAVVKGSKNLEAAKQLVDWASSTDAMKVYGQSRIVIAMPEYGAQLKGLPTNIPSMLLNQDFQWASENRERIIKEFERRYGAKAQKKS